MSIAFVAGTSLNPPTNSGGTTAAINTTGANLICITVPWYTSSPTLSDSKGNTYTLALTKIDGAGVATCNIYYKKNPTVGSGHTFTVSGSLYGSMAVEAFSGVDTAFGIDQISAGGNSTTSPVQPASATAGANGSLIYTGACIYGSGGAPTDTWGINSGMTVQNQVPFNSGVCFGVSGSYLIQTTAAAINPSVTYSGSGILGMAAGTITFRASAGTAYTLTSAQGSFVETGEVVSFVSAGKLIAARGSFTESGQSATLESSRGITTAYGSFVLTGRAATLKAGRKTTATYGAFVETGEAASLLLGRVIDADCGLYALTGVDIDFDDDPKWTAAHICGDTPDPWAKVDPLRRT